MVIDFQPFSFVTNKGFLIDKRRTMPMLQVHTPWWYQDKIEKERIILNNVCQHFFILFSAPTTLGLKCKTNCAAMTLPLCG